MQTYIMQTQQMLRFSRCPSQHLEESWNDVLGGLADRKGQIGSKIFTHEKNQASASGQR